MTKNITNKNELYDFLMESCVSGNIESFIKVWEAEKNIIDIYKITEYGINEIEDLFIASCRYNHIDLVKYLWEKMKNKYFKTRKLRESLQVGFRYICENNNLDAAIWLWSKIDRIYPIPYGFDTIFINMCENGFLDLAEWFWSVRKDDSLHISNYELDGFKRAYENNHLHIVKWLFTIHKPCPFKNLDRSGAFIISCLKNNFIMATWLYDKKFTYYEYHEHQLYQVFNGVLYNSEKNCVYQFLFEITNQTINIRNLKKEYIGISSYLYLVSNHKTMLINRKYYYSGCPKIKYENIHILHHYYKPYDSPGFKNAVYIDKN